jgi:hypothetical protein
MISGKVDGEKVGRWKSARMRSWEAEKMGKWDEEKGT